MAVVERVLFVSPEIPPWMKSGGLGDVTGALPSALREIGLDVRVLVPGYPALLAALRDLTCVANIPQVGALPAARVVYADGASGPPGVPLFVIDSAAAYARPGSAYQDEHGVDWPDNYLRFGLLSRVAALLGRGESQDGWRPDIVHCNDWTTGLAPAYARFTEISSNSPRYLFTIHNLAFQGLYPASILTALAFPPRAFSIEGLEFYGQVSFLKAGLYYSDSLVAVSPSYAREIKTEEAGCGLHGLLRTRAGMLSGIVNGIDTAVWNPATDPHIPHHYDFARLHAKADNKCALQEELRLEPTLELPLLGVVGRLTHQKGLDLLAHIVPELLRVPVQLALLGSGEHELEESFRALALAAPDQVAVRIAFDEGLAHRIEAGADLFIMPSRFEPCGLNQLYSLRYGTLPVVHATGGLADTVTDTGPNSLQAGTANGFSFEGANSAALLDAIERAVEAWGDTQLWQSLQRQAMQQDHSWRKSAEAYRKTYESIASAPRD